MKQKVRKFFSLLLAVCMIFQLMPAMAKAAGSMTTLTFGDSAITETISGDGYSVNGTTLTISAAGTYKITGSCLSGNIEVAKNLSDVTLILDDLNLTSTTGAPIVVKKSSNVTIHIENTVTLTDNENPEDEDSTDEAVADAYEGAAIKVKSGSTVNFCGSGTLNINGNAKNGIKGAATATVTFYDSRTTYHVTAANNGIGSDGRVIIRGGTFDIQADNDGIKSVPEETDAESVGSVEIYGGTFDIEVDGDGIQADTLLKIEGGDFTIKTFGGYEVNGTKYYNVSHNLDKDTAGTFDGDTMSCKALKASGDRADVENEVLITGGTFHINSADDAVHSDAHAAVTGGTFYIYTGDDGMHADTSLTLGAEDGCDRNPEVYVYACFEGLEAGTIYTYEGRYWLNALDDGMNAGGGSDSDSTGDSFVPGGRPGRPGSSESGSTNTSSYKLYVYGGDIYIDCLGDGLDSNGGLYLYGGNLDIFSQGAGGDNSPFDSDGTMEINGATVFGAGSSMMNHGNSSYTQKCTTSNTSVNANTVVNISNGSTVLHSVTLPKRVSYMIYSNPEVTNNVSFATGGTLSSCLATAWDHTWNEGEEDPAAKITTYTCSDCGETETASAALVTDYQCDDTHAYEEEEKEDVETDEGFAVSFSADEGVAGIDVYYTKDYTTPDESDVTSTVSRNGDTGEPDSSGDGQVNFRVRLNSGYSISDITVTSGTYKNIKDSSETGQENTYRITKITADTMISIATVNCGHENVSEPVWTWEEDYSAAKLSLYCADCKSTVEFSGIVTSVLGNDNTITFTAAYTHNGVEYTDTKSAKAFVVTFNMDEGVEGILLYYTQDYSLANETNVSTAVARDSDTGNPVINGDGQVNFRVILKDGYELSSVEADANYKNVKNVSDEEYSNVYRITKITGEVTVSICTSKTEEENPQKPVDPEIPKELVITRIYGSGRCGTAVEAAKELKDDLGVEQYENLILASGSNFADALAGSYLATVKNAAILLYKGTNSVAMNETFIKENLSADGMVYLLGGEAAVPEHVEEGLKVLGINVKRLSGSTRYETNLAILEEAGVNPGEEILVATGRNFADSLSASATGKPILLVNGAGTELSDVQKEFLSQYGGGNLIILGGIGAVSDALENELKVYGTVSRIFGSNRYETSVKIAEEYFEDVDTVVIASGKNFPDGLTGGPVAYAKKSPLLLTNTGSETAGYVTGNPVTRAYIMGGTAAVSDTAVETIFAK